MNTNDTLPELIKDVNHPLTVINFESSNVKIIQAGSFRGAAIIVTEVGKSGGSE